MAHAKAGVYYGSSLFLLICLRKNKEDSFYRHEKLTLAHNADHSQLQNSLNHLC